METQNITFLSFILADNSSFNETFHEDNFSISYSEPNKRDSLYLLIPITLIYVIIFISGCIGNISTCIVIAKNKSMYSATNYYLFSLAVSDFILLVSGAPMELYFYWFKGQFIFGDVFCIVRNMINEMAANATVLTITAFTIERYVAICHPFLSHTISKLSRAVKYIFLIWILSISFATLLALQTGVQVYPETGETHCMMIEERAIIPHTFYISTVLFFFAPMSLITVLYILIGVKLRSSTMITRENGSTIQRNNNLISNNNQNTSQSTKRVLKMLVAVVICFFVSWFPFHAQRLVYNWAMQNENPAEHEFLAKIYFFVTYSSGILYYLSTCINPLLYNIMSNKFRQAFKETLQKKCCTCSSPQTHHQKRQYRILSRGKRRYGQPESTEYSGSGKDDYSSSTQKQSIDTITTSRNTSLKHYKINKSFDTFAKSPSLFAMGPSNARFSESIESTNCHTYLTTKITNSEINISSECNINEIHLNIFPPSATYIKEPPNIFGCQSDEKSLDRSQNYVNIDIHEKLNLKAISSGKEMTEGRRKTSLGHFSHISLKRCDSILHIAIGNSSKVVKRHKRSSWFFTKFWKLSNRRKSSKARKLSFGSHISDKGIHRLSNASVNLINDDLMITINKRTHDHCSSNENNLVTSHLNFIGNDFNDEFLKHNDDIENGANELDCYMNEIKRREMR